MVDQVLTADPFVQPAEMEPHTMKLRLSILREYINRTASMLHLHVPYVTKFSFSGGKYEIHITGCRRKKCYGQISYDLK
jgi:hypothetical protein